MQKKILSTLFKRFEGEPFAVTYSDGRTETYGSYSKKKPLVKIIIKEKLPVTEMLLEPEVRFGEAYMDGKIDFEGDLRDLYRLLLRNELVVKKDIKEEGLIQGFLRRQRNTTGLQQVEKVQHHYDLGNDFFELWLDKTMSYSCGYFRTPVDTLEQAQLQKIDHTLRKLQLKEGETLLDIGSGWGWLIIRAAKEYGVKSLGITLSKEQEEETKNRILREGLDDKVQVRLMDFRDLAKMGYKFDKIVSIGMFEHVGKENIGEYFTAIDGMLEPGGLSLLHTITHPKETPFNPWMEKYIFPWGYIPSLRETIWELPEHSFHLLDLESLRIHYAMTTDHWARNFEAVQGQVEAKYGEKFVRMWRLYLIGCVISFLYCDLDVHQLLFSKGLNNNLPLTREYIYT
ncbi:MAG TPA: cyclopropane-fatty-acyl-phospholipid synthase family protein [Clostridia bacterium]|nr:cyclopropane-fatty-acyl-phospholipid synthase family protein [Clostridia bacterium]